MRDFDWWYDGGQLPTAATTLVRSSGQGHGQQQHSAQNCGQDMGGHCSGGTDMWKPGYGGEGGEGEGAGPGYPATGRLINKLITTTTIG